jgi:hypothetical protein
MFMMIMTGETFTDCDDDSYYDDGDDDRKRICKL